ncbi:hypothetical protein [Mucilaginibacter agri]|uniref:Uncharacterized protein n=1 Tax=Mucilaginibacter agri TaxID=2695265 RepID=A0A965ZC73_9SPHI|nr:hypothetical protein [Mucilaginibacter agri]NCD68030.1 hypothetical protein [Mucilaginibacter agri]
MTAMGTYFIKVFIAISTISLTLMLRIADSKSNNSDSNVIVRLDDLTPILYGIPSERLEKNHGKSQGIFLSVLLDGRYSVISMLSWSSSVLSS